MLCGLCKGNFGGGVNTFFSDYKHATVTKPKIPQFPWGHSHNGRVWGDGRGHYADESKLTA